MKRKECADSLAFSLLTRLVFLSFYSNLLKTIEVPSRVASSTSILRVTRAHFSSTTVYEIENASRSVDIRERLKVMIPHTPPTDQISEYNQALRVRGRCTKNPHVSLIHFEDLCQVAFAIQRIDQRPAE